MLMTMLHNPEERRARVDLAVLLGLTTVCYVLRSICEVAEGKNIEPPRLVASLAHLLSAMIGEQRASAVVSEWEKL